MAPLLIAAILASMIATGVLAAMFFRLDDSSEP